MALKDLNDDQIVHLTIYAIIAAIVIFIIGVLVGYFVF